MNTPTPRPDAARLMDLVDLVGNPSFELGPLDVRDLRAALEELAAARRPAYEGEAALAWSSTPVQSAIATGLREAADAADAGPLAERLRQSASAMDVLCGSIVAALQEGNVANTCLGDLLRAALVTAGAR